jgi:hypothetical protein
MPQFEEILEQVFQQIVAANVMTSEEFREASPAIDIYVTPGQES